MKQINGQYEQESFECEVKHVRSEKDENEESINIIKESLSHIADLKLGNSAPFLLRSFEDECRELIKEATTI